MITPLYFYLQIRKLYLKYLALEYFKNPFPIINSRIENNEKRINCRIQFLFLNFIEERIPFLTFVKCSDDFIRFITVFIFKLFLDSKQKRTHPDVIDNQD